MSRDPELYAVVCMLSVLFVAGTAGNLVVLYVFSRPTRRDRSVAGAPAVVCPSASATVYVMALAAADLVTCSLDIPSTAYMEWVVFRTHFDLFCKFYQFLLTSNIPFSALIIVAIAVDRYVCICHPLRHAAVATAFRARVVVLLLALLALILGLLGASAFSVYHSVPISHDVAAAVVVTPAADDARSHNFTKTSSSTSDKAEVVTGACATGSNRTGCPTTYAVINTGYCGQSNLILSETFLRCYLVVHSLVYPCCIVAVLVLYSLIYRTVLVQRARRLKMHGSSIPLARQPPPTPANTAAGAVTTTTSTTVGF